MNSGADSSGQTTSGHVDLDAVNSTHLIDLTKRCIGRSDVLEEQAIAHTVITRRWVSGTRGFARWSGVSDRVLRNIVGPTGGLSEFKFLWTTTRGVSSAVQEERDSMELRYSDTRTDYRSTSYKLPKAPGGQEALALGDLKLENPSSGNAVVSARITERAQKVLAETLKLLATLDDMNITTGSGKVLRMMDPGLDIWSEIEGEKPDYVVCPPLGRRAWSFAIFCGLQNVVLSVEDIESITGLSKRGVQALLKRMTEANPILVQKVRQGRSFIYRINWFDWVHPAGDYFEQGFTRDEIRRKRASKDHAVQVTSARRGTPAGYIAYLHSTANPKRDEYLAANLLPADAHDAWKALVEAGDELALYEHLRAREAEAGPVPSTPEVLVEKAAVVRPAQEPSGAQRFMALSEQERQETLAAMRRRVSRVGSA